MQWPKRDSDFDNPTYYPFAMAIDNPLDAFEQQYMVDEPELPNKLAKYVAEYGIKLAIPDGGLAAEILWKVAENLFDRESGRERVKAIFELIKKEFEHVETTKASHADVQKAIQVAVWNDWRERDDLKRERYVRLIGNAVKSEEHVQDVISFIQTIEQLNEHDLVVLKVVNNVTNKDGDWNASTHPRISKLHPTTMRNYAEPLSMEIASALGQNLQTNFSREEGYGICNRLQGFGLVHEVQVQPRELPLTNYCFRLSIQGVRLLKLLGEDVPNYELFTAGLQY